MAEEATGQAKPFWVIVSSLEHFLSGHDTEAAAQGEVERLTHQARAQGRTTSYVVIPRRLPDAQKHGTDWL